jgi:hypothetical protein
VEEEEEMGDNFAGSSDLECQNSLVEVAHNACPKSLDLEESYPVVNYSRGHIEDSNFESRVVADVEGSVGNLMVGTVAGCEEGLVVMFDQVQMHSTHEQVNEGAIRTSLRP